MCAWVCVCRRVLSFERYECVDWIDYIRNYRRGYLDILSRVNKQLFYGWLTVSIVTAVQMQWRSTFAGITSVLAQVVS